MYNLQYTLQLEQEISDFFNDLGHTSKPKQEQR